MSARRLLAGVHGDGPLSLAGHEAVHGRGPCTACPRPTTLAAPAGHRAAA